MAMSTAYIVDEILSYDGEPPHADYSPYEFGVQVGSQVASDVASDVVRSCFESLPGTLAESFLDGFLETAAIDSLDDLLFDSIAKSREVGAGGAILRLLERFGGLADSQIAERIMDRVFDARQPSEQDRLCFALWALLCGETYNVGSGRVFRNRGVRTVGRIPEILKTQRLTDYSRSALMECMRAVASCDGDVGSE